MAMHALARPNNKNASRAMTSSRTVPISLSPKVLHSSDVPYGFRRSSRHYARKVFMRCPGTKGSARDGPSTSQVLFRLPEAVSG
eukprot:6419606-Prymnesium_polylepis.1